MNAGSPAALESRREETTKIATFFAQVGLPTHLGQLSLDINDTSAISTIIEGVMAWPGTPNMPFEVDGEMVRRAMLEAHEIGTSVVKEYGDIAYRRLHAD